MSRKGRIKSDAPARNLPLERLLGRIGRVPSQFQAQVALGVAYREVWESVAGRKVMIDLMQQAGLLEVGYVPGEPEALLFNDGRRSIGVHILTMMRWSEGELVQLAIERTGGELAEG